MRAALLVGLLALTTVYANTIIAVRSDGSTTSAG